MIGNKSDCDDRIISYEEAKKMAELLNVDYYETSA